MTQDSGSCFETAIANVQQRLPQAAQRNLALPQASTCVCVCLLSVVLMHNTTSQGKYTMLQTQYCDNSTM